MNPYLPWRLLDNSSEPRNIANTEGRIVASTAMGGPPEEDAARAAFIVGVANHHDALVTAASEALAVLKVLFDEQGYREERPEVESNLRAVLVAARAAVTAPRFEKVTCDRCAGQGFVEVGISGRMEICRPCDGAGRVLREVPRG